jgi:hypothetical protein
VKVVIKCITCRRMCEITTYPSRLKNGKGKYCSEACRRKAFGEACRKSISKNRFSERGENHPNYRRHVSLEERINLSCKCRKNPIDKKDFKGFTRDENLKERLRFRETVARQVLERDDYTCQMCGVRGVALQVDHIQPWADYVELRFDMANCRTLCQKCHYKITHGKEMPGEIKTWGHNFKQVMHLTN